MEGRAKLTLEGLNEDIVRLILEFGYADELERFLHTQCNLAEEDDLQGTGVRRGNPRLFTLKMSRISHRLRVVATSTPTLWTFLDSRYTRNDELAILIQRSRTSGLTVILGEFRADTNVRIFVDATFRESQRWKRLLVHSSGTHPYAMTHLRKLPPNFGKLEFLAHYERDFHCNQTHIESFPAHWKMPALTYFIGNTYPGNGIKVDGLRRLDLIVVDGLLHHHEEDNLAWPTFLAFCGKLAAYSGLTSLCLNFNLTGPFESYYASTFSEVLLPRLIQLQMHADSGYLLNWKLLMAIHAPVLKKFSLAFEYDAEGLLMEHMPQIIDHFPTIHYLDIAMPRGSVVTFEVTRATTALGNLQYLGLRGMQLTVDPSSTTSMSKLHNVRLDSCGGLTDQTAQVLFDGLCISEHKTRLSISGYLGHEMSSDFVLRLKTLRPDRVEAVVNTFP